MRSRYCVRTFFASSITQVNGSAITTSFAILEDKAIRANSFFFNEVSDYRVYAIPAQLLLRLVGRAIANHSDLTIRIVLDLLCGACQQGLSIIAEGY